MADGVATKAKLPRRKRRVGTGGANKISKEEYQDRLDKVEQLMVRSLSRAFVQRYMQEHWGLARATIDRYRAAVQARWETQRMLRQPRHVLAEQRVVYLRWMADLCRKKGEWPTGARYDAMVNEIMGVKAPELIDIRAAVAVADVTPQGPPPLDYDRLTRELTDDQVVQLLEVSARVPSPPERALPAEGTVIDAPRSDTHQP